MLKVLLHHSLIYFTNTYFFILFQGIKRNATTKSLEKAWKDENTLATWSKSAWAQKIDKKNKRKELTDFDRFKVMMAKKERAKLVKK